MAGVSHPTVSRILNNRAKVRPETEKRVRDAARVLDYQPNRFARSLRQQRCHIIGFSFPNNPQRANPDEWPTRDFDDARNAWSQLVMGCHVAGKSRGYDVLLLERREERPGHLKRRDLYPDSVDGLVYIQPSFKHQEYLEISQEGFPLVLVGYCPPHIPLNSCDVDGEAAFFDLTDYMIASGCRNLLYIFARAVDWIIGATRLEGYRRCLQTSQLPYCEENILLGEKSDEEIGQWLNERLTADPTIDGIILANWEAHYPVLDVLQERSLEMPRDIQLAATCDSGSRIAKMQGLTCMQVPMEKMTRQATDLLLDSIEGKLEEARHISVPSEFVVRSTTRLSLEAYTGGRVEVNH